MSEPLFTTADGVQCFRIEILEALGPVEWHGTFICDAATMRLEWDVIEWVKVLPLGGVALVKTLRRHDRPGWLAVGGEDY